VSYPKIMDAAVPPHTAPPGIEGVMGYIGGARATRVWTYGEWLRFQHLRQFPLYVPDLNHPPAPQALDAVTRAKKLGWAAFMPEPVRRVILVDLQAETHPAWRAGAAAVVTAAGFVLVVYGSLSTVLGNAAELVIAADWTGGSALPPVPAGQTIGGLQWEPNVAFGGTMVDYSVFTPALFARGGVGARHGG